MSIVDILKAKGRWFDAAAAYAASLQEEIGSAPRWIQFGHLLKDGGALDAAEEAYRAAIACDGTETDPRLHLAHLLKRRNRLDEALGTFQALRDLPDAPNVDQEIAGLHVALLPENRIGGPIPRPEQVPHHPAHLETALRDLRKGLATAGIGGEPSDKPQDAPRRLRRPATIDAELVPKSDMIIRDGHFVGTTGNPQFEIRCATPCEGGWVEIEFGIEMDAPVIEPILYVEHRPHWQAFSHVRLAPRGGRFHALCLLRQPVLGLRLDPSEVAGVFAVTHFSMRTVGLQHVVLQAWRRNRSATRNALTWRRTKTLAAIEDDLARCLSHPAPDPYQRWIRRHEAAVGADAASLPDGLAPSVLVSWNPDDPAPVADTLASLAAQTCPPASLDILTPRPLSDGERQALLTRRGGIRFHTDLAALLGARADGHIVQIEAGNRFAPHAMLRFAETIAARPETDLVYGDEDHLRDGTRCYPLFKPDWDPDFQAATGYVGTALCIRRTCLTEAMDTLPDGRATWAEAVASVLSRLPPEAIAHLPEILHHRRLKGDRPQRRQPALRRPMLDDWPHVTLIVPTRDSAALLRDCIDSLLAKTDYPHFDILIIDNDSTEEETKRTFEDLKANAAVSVLAAPGPFNFSRLNNLAVAAARGVIVGLVNNDILAIEPDWLKAMVTEAVRPEIGAVGAKLHYRSGHIQHAGMVCGIGFVTGHPHKFRAGDDPGYLDHLVAPHRVSAVTAACLVVEKRKYLEVGGLDEIHLTVAFNDVDFCLKLDAAGYRNLFTPQARLIHLESATRGLDMTPDKAARQRQEAETMLERWTDRIRIDPYYNINLTHAREDYSLED